MAPKSRENIFKNYPQILHGGDYNPDQWIERYPEVVDQDFKLFKLSGCNALSVGIFSWTSYEPKEGVYKFDWLDKIMDRMAKIGNKVILATPSGAKPAWMSEKYPEIRRTNSQGLLEPNGRRHNHCWSSPVYRKKVTEINSLLAERYKNHPALAMWHLSNEYNGYCYCDQCLDSFRKWLKAKYKTLDEINHAYWAAFWSHTYTDWKEIDPRDPSVDGLALDWLRFGTWQIRDFMLHEMKPLRKFTPDVPCTTNFMGFHPQIDYSRLAEIVDIVTDDQYPAYNAEAKDTVRRATHLSFKNDAFRCFKQDKPWMLMESCPDSPQWKYPMKLKHPGIHHAEMLSIIGQGGEGTCYFQWRKSRGSQEKLHGAVVDHAINDIENTRVFKTVAELGALYKKLTPLLGSTVEAETAIIYDWESRWAFETSMGMPNRDGAYENNCVDHYTPFVKMSVPVDVLNSEKDLSKYKLVIAPILFMLRPGMSDKLKKYVEKGGTLVMTYLSAMVNDTNLCYLDGFPGDGLRKVFGIWNEENDCLNSDEQRSVNITAEGRKFGLSSDSFKADYVCGVLQNEGAEVLASYGDYFYAGTPAITVNKYGKGTAYYVGTKPDADFLQEFYQKVVEKAAVKPIIESGIPHGVFAQKREKGKAEFLFFENFTAAEKTVKLPAGKYKNMSDDSKLQDTVTLAPFGSIVLAKI